MGNAENISDIRSFTDAELDDANGGTIAIAVVIAEFCILAGLAWDLPIGATVEDAAGKLGCSHLL
jgi:hypothetical protein